MWVHIRVSLSASLLWRSPIWHLKANMTYEICNIDMTEQILHKSGNSFYNYMSKYTQPFILRTASVSSFLIFALTGHPLIGGMGKLIIQVGLSE